jgi:hypothetical protein
MDGKEMLVVKEVEMGDENLKLKEIIKLNKNMRVLYLLSEKVILA